MTDQRRRSDRTVSTGSTRRPSIACPDHLDEVLRADGGRTRQRPWWSSLERWLPMQTPLASRRCPDRLAPRRSARPRLASIAARSQSWRSLGRRHRQRRSARADGAILDAVATNGRDRSSADRRRPLRTASLPTAAIPRPVMALPADGASTLVRSRPTGRDLGDGLCRRTPIGHGGRSADGDASRRSSLALARRGRSGKGSGLIAVRRTAERVAYVDLRRGRSDHIVVGSSDGSDARS